MESFLNGRLDGSLDLGGTFNFEMMLIICSVYHKRTGRE